MKKTILIIILVISMVLAGIIIGSLLYSSENEVPKEPQAPPQQRDYSPYYNHLDDQHKSLYDYICTSAQLFDDKTEALPYAFEISDLQTVCDSIRADRPDLFYIDFEQLMLEHSDSASIVILKYTDNTENLQEMIDTYKKAIEDFKSLLVNGATDLAKEQSVNDYLCRTCKRSTSENTLHNTAYGALVLKTAYCDGYSYAAKALLDSCGIESYIVYGNAGGESHAWNLVKTELGYAHLDVMWNDADIEEDLRFHGYFNLSDDEIKLDHEISTKYTFLPQAAIAKNFYYQNNLHAETLSGLEEIIYTQLTQAVQTKKGYIELLCDETKETTAIAPYYESARTRLNTELGYEAVYEPFCIYEANKTNNAITVKIFILEGVQ